MCEKVCNYVIFPYEAIKMKRRLINGISIRLSQKNFGQEEDIRLSAFLPIDKTDSAIGKNIRKMNTRHVFWHGLCCFMGVTELIVSKDPAATAPLLLKN